MIVTIPNTEDDNSILLEPETIWKNYVKEGYITQVLIQFIVYRYYISLRFHDFSFCLCISNSRKNNVNFEEL